MRSFSKIYKKKNPYFPPLIRSQMGQPLYLNKSGSSAPNQVSYQVWVTLAKWILRIIFLSISLYITM